MSTAPIAQPVPVPPPLTSDPLVASCDSKALLNALAFVKAGLPTRPPMRVLLGIHLTADSDGVSLSTFDYEVSCAETIPGAGTGAALVPGELLKDMVHALDPGPVQLRVNPSVTHLTVVQNDLELSLPLLPLADYPALPTAKTKQVAALTGKDLVELSRVIVAAGRDSTLPVLTCVAIEQEQGCLRSIATDRYRLAVATTSSRTKLDETLLLPAKTLAFVMKHLAKAERVSLWHSGGNDGLVVFEAGNRRITSRLMCGEFPRYRSLIPSDTPTTINVDVDALMKATKQVALCAARNAPVDVQISQQGLVIRAGVSENANGSKKVDAAVVGVEPTDAVTTAFNPAYLLDGLAAVGAKKRVRFAFSAVTRPVILTDEADTAPAFLYLLMPVRRAG